MRKALFIISILFVFLFLANFDLSAQCAMCTKTAQQLGEKPALGLNKGILYLAVTPLVIMGFIGFKWWKSEKLRREEESQ